MSKINKLYPAFILGSSLLPVSALAVASIDAAVDDFLKLLNMLIGILFAIAVIIFLWGVIKFIAVAGDEAARSKSKGIMTWGIVGIAVMAAVWGIVNALVSYFGFKDKALENLPQVPIRQGAPIK